MDFTEGSSLTNRAFISLRVLYGRLRIGIDILERRDVICINPFADYYVFAHEPNFRGI